MDTTRIAVLHIAFLVVLAVSVTVLACRFLNSVHSPLSAMEVTLAALSARPGNGCPKLSSTCYRLPFNRALESLNKRAKPC